MNHQIKGHNECHIVYILGASSPTYPIAESVYHKGWANANTFLNGREYYGIKLPLETTTEREVLSSSLIILTWGLTHVA